MTAKRIRLAKIRTENLLIEIGCEELPAVGLEKLAKNFATIFAHELVKAKVLNADVLEAVKNKDAKNKNIKNKSEKNLQWFATPRRLAVLIKNVLSKAPAHTDERRGPSVKSAFDEDGKPTAAALGFAKSCGVEVAMLDTLKTDKGAWLAYQQKVGGGKLADIVTDALAEAVRRLPIAKRMRWGAGSEEFVRPVHWLLALHGDAVVKTEVLTMLARNFTFGHRFHTNSQSHQDNLPGDIFINNRVTIRHADDYAESLESQGAVIPSFSKRRSVIQKQLRTLAKKAGARVEVDAGLLEVVTGLVEWPWALLGSFDESFLKLPDEVLVSCMGNHQKYFHLTDAATTDEKLLPGFIAVGNLRSKSTPLVRRGCERVLRARLADAEFFWNSDLKTPIAVRASALNGVLFHNQLGSLHDKSARIAQLACFMATTLSEQAPESMRVDNEHVARAALLCKTDLVSDMVGEFPELQGIMGRYYAQKNGEDTQVASAIEQHYLPRYAGDKLPRIALAQIIAVADRIDSLLGLFACGEAPSGDKDPFALRRAALGVLRILIEKELDLDLYQLLQASADSYADADHVTVTADNKTIQQAIQPVWVFMLERLKAYYQEMGYSATELASVMACRPVRPLDFDRRLKALSHFFVKHPAASASLAAANKRIVGIMGKARKNNSVPTNYDETLFQHKAETELARHLDKIGARVRNYFAANQYDQGFAALSELKHPVDTFFDEVMVMDEDAAVRNNRLALLGNIRVLFLAAADISFMETER